MSPRLLFPLLLAALTACAVPASHEVPLVSIPDSWRDAPASTAATDVDFYTWWKALGDDSLNRLVERALSDNMTLEIAQHRLNQARALTNLASNKFLPTLSFGVETAKDASARNSYLQVGFSTAWALAWPVERVGVAQQAMGEAEAAAAQWQATRVALVSEVARTYGQLRHLQQERALTQRALEIEKTRQRLLNARHALGLETSQHVTQNQARAAQQQSRLSDLDYAVLDTEQALATLVGQATIDPQLTALQAQPEVPAFALNRLPASLLNARPQVALARAELFKAAGDLGVSRAELYPRVALVGSWIYSRNISQNSRKSNSYLLPSVGPIIDIPLFDWGIRVARRDAQKHALAAATTAYRQAVLEGYAQTQMALNAFNAAGDRQTVAATAVHASEQVSRVDAALVQSGVRTQDQGLDSQLALLEAQRSVMAAKAQRLAAFAALFMNLGGASALTLPDQGGA